MRVNFSANGGSAAIFADHRLRPPASAFCIIKMWGSHRSRGDMYGARRYRSLGERTRASEAKSVAEMSSPR
jgi:hypothetical protein